MHIACLEGKYFVSTFDFLSFIFTKKNSLLSLHKECSEARKCGVSGRIWKSNIKFGFIRLRESFFSILEHPNAKFFTIEIDMIYLTCADIELLSPAANMCEISWLDQDTQQKLLRIHLIAFECVYCVIICCHFSVISGLTQSISFEWKYVVYSIRWNLWEFCEHLFIAICAIKKILSRWEANKK